MDPSVETIYVLTRTSGRPRAFARCRASVLAQRFSGRLIHVVSQDDPADDYATGDRLVKVKRGDGPFPANLYMNELMAVCDDGWYVCLDDDDVFTESTACDEIVRAAPDHDRAVVFRVEVRPGWVLPSCALHDIGRAQITGQCVALHSDHRGQAVWQNDRLGDFLMIRGLLSRVNPILLDRLLIRFQNGHGNGDRKDIP